MIPNIIHTCFGMTEDFGGKPFSLVHYIALRSALEIIRPEELRLHYVHEPDGEWWQRIRSHVKLHRIQPRTEINGVRLKHVAHAADLVRLEQLHEHGGIYLDLDTICVKSFEPLLRHHCVLGREGDWGLCNAVILAAPQATFIRKWLEGYTKATSLTDGFRSGEWAEMSVRYPKLLAERIPNEITLLPREAFFTPCFGNDDLRLLFENADYTNAQAYCHHLWEHVSWNRYLANMTPESIASGTGLFDRLAKRYL